MDMKKYADEILELLGKMSDEEFNNLLVESGIEECPMEEDEFIEVHYEQMEMNFTINERNNLEALLSYEEISKTNGFSFKIQTKASYNRSNVYNKAPLTNSMVYELEVA